MSRSRSWCFTWNLVETTPDDLEDILKRVAETPTVEFLVGQLERAPTTGQLHFQGAIHFKNPRTMGGVKRLLGNDTVHLEIKSQNSTWAQVKEYCLKEESRAGFQLCIGEMPRQGRRSDLLEIKALIDENPNLDELDLWDLHFGTMVSHSRAILRYRKLKQPPRTWEVETIVLWGPTGSGKSYRAMTWTTERNVRTYTMPTPPTASCQPWVDGYDSHTAVLLEDFDSSISFRLLLRMMDPYPLLMPVKGGFVNYVPRYLVITSNINPLDWYLEWANMQPHADIVRRPLMRRLANATIYHVERQDQEFNNPFEVNE